MAYNWKKILQDYSDPELFRALHELHLPSERRIVAEKLLLDRKIIIKNENGSCHKEIIDVKFLKLTERNLKSNSIESTLNKLIQNGLDKESSIRLIEMYKVWKKKQQQSQTMWFTLFFIGILLEIISEMVLSLNFLSTVIGFLSFLTIIPILLPLFIGTGFSKNKIFKVLNPVE